MRLALFDLDHTLIPFDSGMAWTRHAVERGLLPCGADDAYLAQCQRYVQGEIDVQLLHRALIAPLAHVARGELDAALRDFEAAMADRFDPAMRAVVERHQRQGDLCAIVTATTRPVAEPFARLLRIEHLLATEPETTRADAARPVRWTGAIAGTPCHGPHKPAHVTRWLHDLGLRLGGFERSSFYTDSAGDLPLLRLVTHPVAVRADAALSEVAVAKGWPVLD